MLAGDQIQDPAFERYSPLNREGLRWMGTRPPEPVSLEDVAYVFPHPQIPGQYSLGVSNFAGGLTTAYLWENPLANMLPLKVVGEYECNKPSPINNNFQAIVAYACDGFVRKDGGVGRLYDAKLMLPSEVLEESVLRFSLRDQDWIRANASVARALKGQKNKRTSFPLITQSLKFYVVAVGLK